uniref:Uncharacterized protein n=1 Tax=Tanacetum cinerariifolium TaxID=118510 RepID=A0A6L2P3M9_TANCI|nr:hypothetical protein [Tanacetum cinerariifolium]
MSADVTRGHGGDSGGDDRPPLYQIPTGKGTRKLNLGGRRAGMMHTRQENRNLGLKAITDKNCPVPVRFEFGDRETPMPLGDHAAHWANYIGVLVRELPLHYPSWRQMPPERKAGVMEKIETQFDLCPHMESDRWPQIYAGIQQHLQKIYNGKKTALNERLLKIKNQAKSKVVCRQGSRSIAALRDMHMESSATREYPSLIHTFFLTHTVGDVFLNPEEKALYRGHILGVGRVLPRQDMVIPSSPPCTHSSDVSKLKKSEKLRTKQVNMFLKLFKTDDKFSQMLTQLESQPEYDGGSESGECRDDEPGDDEDGGEDGEDGDNS